MSPRKRALFVNGWGIVGITVSVVLVPGDLPFWIWAVSSATALAVMNCIAFWKRGAATKGDAPRAAKGVSRSDLLIYGGAVFLAVDLIWRYFSKRG
jgi:hypothetical protein